MAADFVSAVHRLGLGTRGHPVEPDYLDVGLGYGRYESGVRVHKFNLSVLGDRMVVASLTEWGSEIAGVTRDRPSPPPTEEWSHDTVCRTAR